jgi:hypothetical protein
MSLQEVVAEETLLWTGVMPSLSAFASSDDLFFVLMLFSSVVRTHSNFDLVFFEMPFLTGDALAPVQGPCMCRLFNRTKFDL